MRTCDPGYVMISTPRLSPENRRPAAFPSIEFPSLLLFPPVFANLPFPTEQAAIETRQSWRCHTA